MSRGIGIDIGAESVKVAEALVRGAEAQAARVASFARAELGVDSSDPDALARAAAARAADQGIRGGPAVAGLSGRDVILRYMNVPPAPLWKLHQLMDYEVGEITGADPGEFAHDFRPLTLPQRMTDELLLLVGVARNDVLERRLEASAQGGLRVASFCPDSVALFEAFRRSVEAPPREVVALLDVGAAKTEVVIVRNQALVFARSVMPGGREFTEAVAETLEVSLERAEEIKRRRGAVLDRQELRQRTGQEAEFAEALAAVASQLVGSVQSTLMFARTQTKLTELEPSRYYLCGGGARLRGLREHLAGALGRPVEWLDLAQGFQGLGDAPEPPSPYAVALGLGVAAASPRAFALRLLPERVRRRRAFRRKGAFAYAAAAMVPLALLVSLLGTLHHWRAARRQVAEAEQALRDAAAEQEAVEETRARIDETRRKVTLLADRVRANQFALKTLLALREETPDAIVLQSLRLEVEPAREALPGEQPRTVTFHIRGVATQRYGPDANEELARFLDRLRGPPLYARVRYDDRTTGTTKANEVAFEVGFAPSESLIAEDRREPGSGG
ncbi:MAG: pilus assembly protein PilM [Candidatus Brocadiia bacterium]